MKSSRTRRFRRRSKFVVRRTSPKLSHLATTLPPPASMFSRLFNRKSKAKTGATAGARRRPTFGQPTSVGPAAHTRERLCPAAAPPRDTRLLGTARRRRGGQQSPPRTSEFRGRAGRAARSARGRDDAAGRTRDPRAWPRRRCGECAADVRSGVPLAAKATRLSRISASPRLVFAEYPRHVAATRLRGLSASRPQPVVR